MQDNTSSSNRLFALEQALKSGQTPDASQTPQGSLFDLEQELYSDKQELNIRTSRAGQGGLLKRHQEWHQRRQQVSAANWGTAFEVDEAEPPSANGKTSKLVEARAFDYDEPIKLEGSTGSSPTQASPAPSSGSVADLEDPELPFKVERFEPDPTPTEPVAPSDSSPVHPATEPQAQPGDHKEAVGSEPKQPAAETHEQAKAFAAEVLNLIKEQAKEQASTPAHPAPAATTTAAPQATPTKPESVATPVPTPPPAATPEASHSSPPHAQAMGNGTKDSPVDEAKKKEEAKELVTELLNLIKTHAAPAAPTPAAPEKVPHVKAQSVDPFNQAMNYDQGTVPLEAKAQPEATPAKPAVVPPQVFDALDRRLDEEAQAKAQLSQAKEVAAEEPAAKPVEATVLPAKKHGEAEHGQKHKADHQQKTHHGKADTTNHQTIDVKASEVPASGAVPVTEAKSVEASDPALSHRFDAFDQLLEKQSSAGSLTENLVTKVPNGNVSPKFTTHLSNTDGTNLNQEISSAMMKLEDLVKKLRSPVNTIHDLIKHIDEIRFFIADSINFGHKTNTFHLNNTLDDLKYQGKKEIVFCDQAAYGACQEIFPILTKAGIEVIQDIRDIIRNNYVPLCVTGGMDLEQVHEIFPQLKTHCLIITQPYKWELETRLNKQPEHSAIYYCKEYFEESSEESSEKRKEWSQNHRETGRINLELEEFAYPSPPIANINSIEWQNLKNENLENILKNILKEQNSYVATMYGIAGGNYSLKAADLSERILQRYCKALLAALGEKSNKSFIFVFHDNFAGEGMKLTGYENDYIFFSKEELINCSYKVFLEKITSKKIIILKIGKVPQDLFNYCFHETKLPCVFEGAGTIPVAFDRGRPFFYIKGFNKDKKSTEPGDIFYPDLNKEHTNDATKYQKIANTLIVEKLEQEDHVVKELQSVIEESINGRSQYFEKIKEWNEKPENNKFIKALEGSVKAGCWKNIKFE